MSRVQRHCKLKGMQRGNGLRPGVRRLVGSAKVHVQQRLSALSVTKFLCRSVTAGFERACGPYTGKICVLNRTTDLVMISQTEFHITMVRMRPPFHKIRLPCGADFWGQGQLNGIRAVYLMTTGKTRQAPMYRWVPEHRYCEGKAYGGLVLAASQKFTGRTVLEPMHPASTEMMDRESLQDQSH